MRRGQQNVRGRETERRRDKEKGCMCEIESERSRMGREERRERREGIERERAKNGMREMKLRQRGGRKGIKWPMI